MLAGKESLDSSIGGDAMVREVIEMIGQSMLPRRTQFFVLPKLPFKQDLVDLEKHWLRLRLMMAEQRVKRYLEGSIRQNLHTGSERNDSTG